MATEQGGIDISFKAARDMSAGRYHGVEMSANDTVDYPDSAKLFCVGILQNKPAAAGRGATVRIAGHTKVMAGGTIAFANAVTIAASGWVVKATSGSAAHGICVKGANSGYPGEIVFAPAYTLSATSAETNQG